MNELNKKGEHIQRNKRQTVDLQVDLRKWVEVLVLGDYIIPHLNPEEAERVIH